MRRNWIAITALVPALAACNVIGDNQKVSAAKEAIKGELSDPGSAQFRSVRVGAATTARETGFVCGEVNAKNRMGGYVGYRRFMYAQATNMKQVEYPDTEPASAELAMNRRLFDYLWKKSCLGEDAGVTS